LDTPDNHIPKASIGAFLTDLNVVKYYTQQEFLEYNARTKHYERIYQVVKALDDVSDANVAE
jgi:hypothetical protein